MNVKFQFVGPPTLAIYEAAFKELVLTECKKPSEDKYRGMLQLSSGISTAAAQFQLVVIFIFQIFINLIAVLFTIYYFILFSFIFNRL